MARLSIQDDMITNIHKMVDGNPGATFVLSQVFNNANIVDPDNNMGRLGPIFLLDTFGIYGPNIWVLWKDHCGADLSKFLLLLRATQLGFFPVTELQRLSNERNNEFSIDNESLEEFKSLVSSHVPSFKTEPFFV